MWHVKGLFAEIIIFYYTVEVIRKTLKYQSDFLHPFLFCLICFNIPDLFFLQRNFRSKIVKDEVLIKERIEKQKRRNENAEFLR